MIKISCKKLLFARVSRICFCLLVFSTPAAASESNGEPDPVSTTVTDTQGDGEKTDVKHEDILDRAFSPLDRAVSDINRDLNKGEDSADTESSE